MIRHLLIPLLIIPALFACGGGSSGDSDTSDATSTTTELQAISGDEPIIQLWQENMSHWGRQHCEHLNDGSLTQEDRLGATYYDSLWVYQQIRSFTGDTYWDKCIRASRGLYRDYFVLGADGRIPGYWIFTHGLEHDIAHSGDSSSQRALEALVDRAAFANVQTPLEWTVDQELSREVAYNILSFLSARRLGLYYPEERLQQFVSQALGHISQWTSGRSPYLRPFMVSLTAHALIEYYQAYGDIAVVAAIQEALDTIWNRTWIESASTFQYTDRDHSSGGTEPAPDLNLLIAPAFMWLHVHTNDMKYYQRAEAIFAGGVTQAWLGNPKQFNQSYRWSFQYLHWRSQALNAFN